VDGASSSTAVRRGDRGSVDLAAAPGCRGLARRRGSAGL